MLKKVETHISQELPFLKKASLLIAVSGGIDSVVLAHILHQLHYTISIAHCNFNLRGIQSDLDETFVMELGSSLKIQTHLQSFDTAKIAKKKNSSIQLTARELRYDWFKELLQNHQYDYVLTGHHLDDALETFLINLSRGTGLEGLLGIPVVNNHIVRPLLPFSRAEILQFAIAQKLNWREDQSNASTKYLRNKIRHQIVPVLKELNPSLLDSFQKTTTFLKQSQDFIDESVQIIKQQIWTEEPSGLIKIDIKKLKKNKNPKAILYQLLKAYQFTAWDDVSHLLDAQTGKTVFSKTHQLLKDRGVLLLAVKKTDEKTEKIHVIEEGTTKIEHPVSLSFTDVLEKGAKKNTHIYVNKDLLKYPLCLRKWKNGDVFYPAGMKGKKKLSNYFKDEKYSLIDKENTWLLCSEDKIVWVVGKRQDRRFMVNDKTTNTLLISL